jgi:hypothetical protein
VQIGGAVAVIEAMYWGVACEVKAVVLFRIDIRSAPEHAGSGDEGLAVAGASVDAVVVVVSGTGVVVVEEGVCALADCEYKYAYPLNSTAAQNDGDGHETDPRPRVLGSIGCPLDHVPSE